MNLWLGWGFQSGLSAAEFHQALAIALDTSPLNSQAPSGIATIARKQSDPEFLKFTQAWGGVVRFFSSTQLAQIPSYHPSPKVKTLIQTPSVAEAAALLATDSGKLIISKQVLRSPHSGNYLTWAVACSQAGSE